MMEFCFANRTAATLVLGLTLFATQSAMARRILHPGGTTGATSANASGENQRTTPAKDPSAGPVPPSSTPGLNTNIYDKSDDLMSFTDTVKLIRDLDGTMDVIFTKQKGSFQGPIDSTAQAKLAESQKSKTPVTVTAETYSRQIRSVSGANEGSGKSKGSNDW